MFFKIFQLLIFNKKHHRTGFTVILNKTFFWPGSHRLIMENQCMCSVICKECTNSVVVISQGDN